MQQLLGILLTYGGDTESVNCSLHYCDCDDKPKWIPCNHINKCWIQSDCDALIGSYLKCKKQKKTLGNIQPYNICEKSRRWRDKSETITYPPEAEGHRPLCVCQKNGDKDIKIVHRDVQRPIRLHNLRPKFRPCTHLAKVSSLSAIRGRLHPSVTGSESHWHTAGTRGAHTPHPITELKQTDKSQRHGAKSERASRWKTIL